MGLSLASMGVEMAAWFRVERGFRPLMWSSFGLVGAAVEFP